MLDSEPGTLTYALTQSRLERQARERAERGYEPGLYRRYVAGDSVGDGATHWYEYDRAPDAERAVAAWEKVKHPVDAWEYSVQELRAIAGKADAAGCSDAALIVYAVASALEAENAVPTT